MDERRQQGLQVIVLELKAFLPLSCHVGHIDMAHMALYDPIWLRCNTFKIPGNGRGSASFTLYVPCSMKPG